MKILNVVLVALMLNIVMAVPARAQAAQATSLRQVALRVVALDLRRQLASAKPATVDSLLALYSDSVVYEHPSVGAVIRGKGMLRNGMLQYIGSVRAVKAKDPRVTVGHNVAIVETAVQMEVEDGDKWVPVTRHGLRVIEFDSRGLVRRVIDYPW